MDRIINLERIILKEDEILMEVFYKEQLILRPDTSSNDEFDYCKVLAVGYGVKDIKKDDIILQMTSDGGFKVGNRVFAMARRYYIGVAVHPENFLIPSKAEA